MARTITVTLEVSEKEYENFLGRLSQGTPEENPAPEAPAEEINTSDVDTNGVPWIEAVHAATKTKTADGKWRGRKGVSIDDRANAEAAYKKQPDVVSTEEAKVINDAAKEPEAFVPPAFLTGGVPGFPPVAPPAPVSYQELVAKFGELHNANKMTPQAISTVYGNAGVTNPADLTTDESMRARVMDELNKL